VRRVLVVVAVSTLLTSCYSRPEDQVYRPPGVAAADDARSGEELYLRDCAWCHGRTGEGTERGPDVVDGTNGPAFVDFVLSTGRMPLQKPDQRMMRGDPAYSEQEIEAIVAFVESLGAEGPDIPELALEDAELSHGLVLYQENCAACHSTTGIGGALTEGTRTTAERGPGRRRIVIPPVTAATPLEIAEAIRVGPGTMPVFNEDVIDQDDLNAIVAYSEYLKNPDDRGGAGLGRIGPVVEGAVGWIVGLGLLLIFIRWIGTKRGEP